MMVVGFMEKPGRHSREMVKDKFLTRCRSIKGS